MGYVLDFVGLINFFGDTTDQKLLLFPDGTSPSNPKIPPHYANLFVVNPQVQDSTLWPAENDPVMQHINVSRFAISKPSTITISGQASGDGRGSLTIAPQDEFVARLKEVDPKIDIVPDKAATIARLPINNGTLSAFVLGTESVVAQLAVNHNDLLEITATPDDGSAAKTLILRKGAEVVISNTSKIGEPKLPGEVTHFKLYAQLDVNRDDSGLSTEPPPHPKLDQIASAHPYISFLRDTAGHIPLPGCSIINCCTCCDR